MTVKLLTEHHLKFLSLKRDCTGSSESTLVKMPHCWKSHVTAQIETDNYSSYLEFQPWLILHSIHIGLNSAVPLKRYVCGP